MSKCGACGAELRWAVSKNGKRMPIDYMPAENGNVELVPTGGPFEAVVHGSAAKREELRAQGISLYTSHHFTCPEGQSFRR